MIKIDNQNIKLVPNCQANFSNNVSGILGFNYVKNSPKTDIEFEVPKGKNQQAQTFSKTDLADNLQITELEQKTESKPSGMYLVNTTPCHTIVHAEKRSGLLFKYIKPFIDLNTRADNAPTIVSVTMPSHLPKVKHNIKYELRNYASNTEPSCYIDMLPYIFDTYMHGYIASDLLEDYATSIYGELSSANDPIYKSVEKDMFILSAIFLFREFAQKIKHAKSITEKSRIFDELESKATLHNLHKFMQELISTKIKPDKLTKIARKRLFINQDVTEMSLFEYRYCYVRFVDQFASDYANNIAIVTANNHKMIVDCLRLTYADLTNYIDQLGKFTQNDELKKVLPYNPSTRNGDRIDLFINDNANLKLLFAGLIRNNAGDEVAIHDCLPKNDYGEWSSESWISIPSSIGLDFDIIDMTGKATHYNLDANSGRDVENPKGMFTMYRRYDYEPMKIDLMDYPDNAFPFLTNYNDYVISAVNYTGRDVISNMNVDQFKYPLWPIKLIIDDANTDYMLKNMYEILHNGLDRKIELTLAYEAKDKLEELYSNLDWDKFKQNIELNGKKIVAKFEDFKTPVAADELPIMWQKSNSEWIKKLTKGNYQEQIENKISRIADEL